MMKYCAAWCRITYYTTSPLYMLSLDAVNKARQVAILGIFRSISGQLYAGNRE